jgi:S1-C subfamily serine protease
MADHDGATPRLIKTGIGVFMNERGSLLTDLHVAWPCRRLLVSYGDATNEATIFTFDIALDLAVLDTAFRRVQTAVFAVAQSLSVGESVSIIGYALHETSSRAPISAQGTITALGLFGNEDFFWTSAGSRQGQSGGPVIDERGLVIGLLKGSSKTQDPAIEASSSTQNRSLAIAGERIAGFLERSKIAFRKSTSDGAIGETHSTASRAGIIGLVECWG